MFFSHYTKGTQWTHPRTGRKKIVEGGNYHSIYYNQTHFGVHIKSRVEEEYKRT